MRRMPLLKIITFIIFLISFGSCLEFNPFYKYDSDPQSVDVHWSVQDMGGGLFNLSEYHPDSNSNSEVFFDGVNFNFTGNESISGRAPDFGIQPSMSEQAPYGTMWEFLDYFLSPFTFNTGGTKDSTAFPEYDGLDPFITNYNSYITNNVEVPFSADIHGIQIVGFIDTSMFQTSGNLSVIEFDTISNDPFMSGEGMVIFHSGYPNGIIYFYFRHDSGFTTYAYQWSGGSSSVGNFFGEMNGDYRWVMFPH